MECFLLGVVIGFVSYHIFYPRPKIEEEQDDADWWKEGKPYNYRSEIDD